MTVRDVLEAARRLREQSVRSTKCPTICTHYFTTIHVYMDTTVLAAARYTLLHIAEANDCYPSLLVLDRLKSFHAAVRKNVPRARAR